MFNPLTPFDPAGDVMRHYRKNAATAEFVSLKHYEIKDLVPLMGHLAELPKMKTLVLADNLLSRLPEDMASLKALETLDLSRNPIPNAASIIRGLYSLPQLKNLTVTLPEEEEDQIVAMLSHLKTLNGVPLDVDVFGDAPPSNLPMSAQSMLESIRSGTNVEIPRGYTAGQRVSKKSFQVNPWSSETTAPFLRIQRAVEKVAPTLSNPEEYSDYVGLVESHVYSKIRSEPDPLKSARSQLLAKFLLIEYSFDELTRALAKLGPDISEAAHQIFKGHLQIVSEASALIEALQLDRDSKIDAIQEDLAKELLQKERANTSPTRVAAANHPVSISDTNDPSESATPRHAQRAPERRSQNSANEEIIPLGELRAMLQLLFDSKKRHDVANRTAKLPCETVEQHIYTFLYSRCASDEEITHRVRLLYQSIRYHAKNELDIEILSLILRHELDEEYWVTFEKQREVVHDVMHSVLAVSHISAVDPVLEEDEALTITRLVGNSYPNLADQLGRSVKRAMAKSDGGDRLIITTSALGNAVLRCLVAEYIASLRPVATLFHQFDPDRSGIISTSKLQELLHAFFPGISTARIQEIVANTDPFSNDIISFSDLVLTMRKFYSRRSDSASEISSPQTKMSSGSPRKTSVASTGV